LLPAAFFIVPVTAESTMEKTENSEIIVIPSVDKYNPLISGTKAQNQISEGEIISHSKYVWPFTSKIDVTNVLGRKLWRS
jgi:hypothetical protein